MKSFLSRFQPLVLFVLSGFDRLRFCGESRLLNHARGVQSSCYQQRIRFCDFPDHAESLTKSLRAETYQQLGDVPLQHLNSPAIDKEEAALALALKHGKTQGRIAVLTCQESGVTYRLRKNKDRLVEADDRPKSWQHLRKGVADMPRRAEVADAANKRLSESLASVAETTTLGEPMIDKDGRRRARALNPLTGNDGELLRTIAQGEYLINGFRNRDLRKTLFGECQDAKTGARQSAKITRLLAILKAHGLILRVQKTHRYQLTALGRRVVTALLAAHAADAQQFTKAA